MFNVALARVTQSRALVSVPIEVTSSPTSNVVPALAITHQTRIPAPTPVQRVLSSIRLRRLCHRLAVHAIRSHRAASPAMVSVLMVNARQWSVSRDTASTAKLRLVRLAIVVPSASALLRLAQLVRPDRGLYKAVEHAHHSLVQLAAESPMARVSLAALEISRTHLPTLLEGLVQVRDCSPVEPLRGY